MEPPFFLWAGMMGTVPRAEHGNGGRPGTREFLRQEENAVESLLHATTEVRRGGGGAGRRHVGPDVRPVGAKWRTLELQPIGMA